MTATLGKADDSEQEMEMMDDKRIARIAEMETMLVKAEAAVHSLSSALDQYESVTDQLHKLEEYYVSGEWRSDFESDEDGLIPDDVRRGVLSEDALYNILADNDELLERIQQYLTTISDMQSSMEVILDE